MYHGYILNWGVLQDFFTSTLYYIHMARINEPLQFKSRNDLDDLMVCNSRGRSKRNRRTYDTNRGNLSKLCVLQLLHFACLGWSGFWCAPANWLQRLHAQSGHRREVLQQAGETEGCLCTRVLCLWDRGLRECAWVVGIWGFIYYLQDIIIMATIQRAPNRP